MSDDVSEEVLAKNNGSIRLVDKADKDSKDVWGVPNSERGKLLLEIYNGGTFKKSMNYHSFRDSEKSRQSREISIENLETDSLEISGSQLTVLPSSETSRRSRLSDIFPDILNFKSLNAVAERDIPTPDYGPSTPDPVQSLSPISEMEPVDKNVDEKPVKQTQYYFGDHVIEKRSDTDHSETKVKFNLDLRSAMFQPPAPRDPRVQHVSEGLSSLDILPEPDNTKPSLNRARMRRLFESQSTTSNKRMKATKK